MAALPKPEDYQAIHQGARTSELPVAENSALSPSRSSQDTLAAFQAYVDQWDETADEQEASLLALIEAIDGDRPPGFKKFSCE